MWKNMHVSYFTALSGDKVGVLVETVSLYIDLLQPFPQRLCDCRVNVRQFNVAAVSGDQ